MRGATTRSLLEDVVNFRPEEAPNFDRDFLGDPRLYVCQAPNAFICVSSSVSILGPFWVHFGSILGPFWVHFGSILGPFWVHFGSILGPFWVHFGSISGPFRVHFGSISGPFARIGI